MASKIRKICRICGKEYFICVDKSKLGTYLQIVCSPACWSKYEDLVNAPNEVKE